MTVTHSPAGYAGTVDEIAEARRFGLAAPPFRVASVTDWAPSADPSVNRQVNISAGQAVAYGVADVTTTPDSVAFAANNGTLNRYDALVATFAWAANAGAGLTARTVTFRAIAGTTSPPQANATSSVDNTKINRIKGVQYDALIAIVRIRPGVGLFTSGDVVDSRMWGGYEGYANTGSAQYLTSLDTQPGALVRAVDSDIVWSRNLSGVWGFEKWIGSDKTKQPMISLRYPGNGPIPDNLAIAVGAWPNVTDHGTLGGVPLLSYVSNAFIRCNVPGRVRVDWYAFSDGGSDGWSAVGVGSPAGGGNYVNSMDDRSARSSGFAGAGVLRQSKFGGPFQVQPGDQFGMTVQQSMLAPATLQYDLELSVTYV